MPIKFDYTGNYTFSGISQLNKEINGVYCIAKDKTPIYVGKSNDCRERLLQHFNGDNPCIDGQFPSWFIVEIVVGDTSNREKQLIEEYKPHCNKKVG